jgi:uncharacterized repeat protein (TIGR03803 family)
MSPGGTLTTIYSSCSLTGCVDGLDPERGSSRLPAGTTKERPRTAGAITLAARLAVGLSFLQITPGGTLTTMHSFCSESDCPDGAYPQAGLDQATNGDLYGTTSAISPLSGMTNGYGTVFKITPSGALTTLYTFWSQSACADGQKSPGGARPGYQRRSLTVRPRAAGPVSVPRLVTRSILTRVVRSSTLPPLARLTTL